MKREKSSISKVFHFYSFAARIAPGLFVTDSVSGAADDDCRGAVVVESGRIAPFQRKSRLMPDISEY